MKLSWLALLLGLGYGLPQLYALIQPDGFRGALRSFPRSAPWGYALMGLGTAWFLWNLQQENISDFAAYKPVLLGGFAFLGVACCIYVKDYLAIRGLAVVLLLVAKLTVDTARWADSSWRLVLVTWAYVWVILAIWWSVSPWRLRDWIQWFTQDDRRLRTLSLIRLAFGLWVAILGLTQF
jgi:hypothetical protein